MANYQTKTLKTSWNNLIFLAEKVAGTKAGKHLAKRWSGKIALVLAGTAASATPAHALTINASYSSEIDLQTTQIIEDIAETWEQELKDPVTINLNFSFSNSLPTGILGGSKPAMIKVNYKDYLTGLAQDGLTEDDVLAVQNKLVDPEDQDLYAQYLAGMLERKKVKIDKTKTFDLLIDNTFNSDGSSSTGNGILDNNGNNNNQKIWLTRANAKALKILKADDNKLDANIVLSDAVNWDMDASDGIAADAYDFRTVVLHEIGHALGFVSGADAMEFLSMSSTGTLNDDDISYITPMNTYMYSDESAALGVNDLRLGQGIEKYMSLNGGTTKVTTTQEIITETLTQDTSLDGTKTSTSSDDGTITQEKTYTSPDGTTATIIQTTYPDGTTITTTQKTYPDGTTATTTQKTSSDGTTTATETSTDDGTITKDTSLEGTTTTTTTIQESVAAFSTGGLNVGGDGYQTSHWKDSSTPLGIMNPSLNMGQSIAISELDLKLLDVTGWDLIDPMEKLMTDVGLDWTNFKQAFDANKATKVGLADSLWASYNPGDTIAEELMAELNYLYHDIDPKIEKELLDLQKYLIGEDDPLKEQAKRVEVEGKIWNLIYGQDGKLQNFANDMLDVNTQVRLWLNKDIGQLSDLLRDANRVQIHKLQKIVADGSEAEQLLWEDKLRQALGQFLADPDKALEEITKTNDFHSPMGGGSGSSGTGGGWWGGWWSSSATDDEDLDLYNYNTASPNADTVQTAQSVPEPSAIISLVALGGMGLLTRKRH